MARGGCDFSELVEFQKKMEMLTNNMGEILDICARELAQRLMAKVIKRTPVGQYPAVTGKKGGTLRRGWVSKSHAEAASGKGSPTVKDIEAWAKSLRIYHGAGIYMIEISNPVEYASYVEYGHRTANHTGWVPGHFMMTISVEEIQRDAPAILERKIKKLMEAQLK